MIAYGRHVNDRRHQDLQAADKDLLHDPDDAWRPPRRPTTTTSSGVAWVGREVTRPLIAEGLDLVASFGSVWPPNCMP
jgi:hypothetical protein